MQHMVTLRVKNYYDVISKRCLQYVNVLFSEPRFLMSSALGGGCGRRRGS